MPTKEIRKGNRISYHHERKGIVTPSPCGFALKLKNDNLIMHLSRIVWTF